MTEEKIAIKNAIQEAIEYGKNGKIKACKSHLHKIYSYIQKEPFILWNDNYISQLGKVIIMMIHWDLIEEEEENIGLAHLAYLYISKAIEDQKKMLPETDSCELFRLYKDRIIVLKSFDDFFIDSLQEFYFAGKKASNLDSYNEQRKVVLSRLPFMQFADIYTIEQDYPNLRDDEFLLELANYIEHDKEFTDEDLKEAFLLHKILYKSVYEKLKNKSLVY